MLEHMLRMAMLNADRTKNSEVRGIAIPIPANVSPDDMCNMIASIVLSDIIDDVKREEALRQKQARTSKDAKEAKASKANNPTPCKCTCPNFKPIVNVPTPVAIESVKNYGTTTVIFWTDGTKTIAICDKDDNYNPETGFAIAVAKKFMGNEGFHNALVEYVYPSLEKKCKEETNVSVDDNTPADDKLVDNTTIDDAEKSNATEEKKTEKKVAKKTTTKSTKKKTSSSKTSVKKSTNTNTKKSK